ncbi:MAG: TetR/AcrR family transcriptional regulator [Nocardia sp.]|nr:TetR/AcrR family transcriptional regulator [Nocardia sp.]
MGRPPIHDHDSLLAAAARLFAANGARAVTMAAVARSTGAPSGSVYHRFPDRPTLLAALWLRTARRFFDGYARLVDVEPAPADAVTAATWVVDWCRDNLAEATVLQAGARTFQPDEWSDAARAQLAEQETTQNRVMQTAVQAIAAQTGHPLDHIKFALVDLPLAVIRPYLTQDEPPPARATELVRELAGTLLARSNPG